MSNDPVYSTWIVEIYNFIGFLWSTRIISFRLFLNSYIKKSPRSYIMIKTNSKELQDQDHICVVVLYPTIVSHHYCYNFLNHFELLTKPCKNFGIVHLAPIIRPITFSSFSMHLVWITAWFVNRIFSSFTSKKNPRKWHPKLRIASIPQITVTYLTSFYRQKIPSASVFYFTLKFEIRHRNGQFTFSAPYSRLCLMTCKIQM